MKHRDLEKNSSTQLSQLISIDDSSLFAWSQKDLAALLTHQLDSPLEVDLMTVPKSPEAQRQAKALLAERPGETFAALLLREDPPLETLNLVKTFAKTAQSAADAGIPREVGIVLYYAAIAAALVRLNERVTQLADKDFAAGLEWAMRCAWLDQRLAPLFTAAQKKL